MRYTHPAPEQNLFLAHSHTPSPRQTVSPEKPSDSRAVVSSSRIRAFIAPAMRRDSVPHFFQTHTTALTTAAAARQPVVRAQPPEPSPTRRELGASVAKRGSVVLSHERVTMHKLSLFAHGSHSRAFRLYVCACMYVNIYCGSFHTHQPMCTGPPTQMFWQFITSHARARAQ